MIHEEYSWRSFDGLEMFAQSWKPEVGTRAAIVLVHGVGEHSGRYPYFVKELIDSGYAVNAYDLRGHGKSEGLRVYAPSYEALLRDIDMQVENTTKRFPRVPQVLYGHSFGAAQALCYVMKRRPLFAAVVASSPGWRQE